MRSAADGPNVATGMEHLDGEGTSPLVLTAEPDESFSASQLLPGIYSVW